MARRPLPFLRARCDPTAAPGKRGAGTSGCGKRPSVQMFFGPALRCVESV